MTTRARGRTARTAFAKSTPLIPGIDISEMMRSKSSGAAVKAARASSGRVKPDTRCPIRSSIRLTMKTRGSSSSRYRIRALAMGPRPKCRIGKALQKRNELASLRRCQGERAKASRAAALVMFDHGFKRRNTSIVHVRCSERDVSQRRYAHRLLRYAVARERRLGGRPLGIAPRSGKIEPRVAARAPKTL